MIKNYIWMGVLSVILSGCGSSYPKFDIEVSPSTALVKKYGYYPSVEVDVAGLSESDAVKFSSYPVDKYFEDNSGLRAYLEPYTMHFSQEDLKTKVLDPDNEAFARIMEKEPVYLVLIANLPYADKESKTLDPRKYILRIEDGFFSSQSDLYIKIGATGLIKTTKREAIKDSPSSLESENQPVNISLRCTGQKNSKDLSCKTMKNKE
ncbi:MAG: hypothetical protein ACI4UM_07840 [Succinivibrio sp.]